jgi:hypothetical protein
MAPRVMIDDSRHHMIAVQRLGDRYRRQISVVQVSGLNLFQGASNDDWLHASGSFWEAGGNSAGPESSAFYTTPILVLFTTRPHRTASWIRRLRICCHVPDTLGRVRICRFLETLSFIKGF